MSPARSLLLTLVSAFLAVVAVHAGAVTPIRRDTVIGHSIGPFTPPANHTAAVSPKLATSNAKAVGKPGGVFICQNTDWQGECGYAVQPLNECIVLVAPWLETVSSFGPDNGATCFAFSSGNCDSNEAQWSFTFPGDNTGGEATSNPWNDKITNFACTPS
ncbi:hypothetical protein FB45DRAFT_449969 [Roridomyces roridus]|uniref:Uncharacterized protein n=1 Tax=Roridomyces roridus TaxID=1738132 RepID=A0AAD7C219_9AGAR|nr:hypothetical protein FB45DRAFT_449969 [Roridomyces roridus]